MNLMHKFWSHKNSSDWLLVHFTCGYLNTRVTYQITFRLPYLKGEVKNVNLKAFKHW